MSKVTIELEYDQVEAIVLRELTNVLEGIKLDKENAEKGCKWVHADDVKQYPKDIKALKRVIKMYTVPNILDEVHIRG